MSMTVITLTNVPNSLRGDLTKWLQEISTGVYVGNINPRVREELWKRIIENIKQGQATLSFVKQNEIGYDFMVHNTKREVTYYDGIPLVFLPKDLKTNPVKETGFSDAAKYQKLKRLRQHKKDAEKDDVSDYVVIDIETTGLNHQKDYIIEIGAIKKKGDDVFDFQELVKCDIKLQKDISELTGITDKMLANQGKDINIVLKDLLEFIGDSIIVGYNVNFDLSFINSELKRVGKERLSNKSICLMRETKRKKSLLRDYKLNTVLNEYDIKTEGLHRAYIDAKAEYELALKLNIL